MTDDRPAPNDVESYLEDIERDGWSVEDYSASYGQSDPVTITVELEWSKPLPSRGHAKIKRLIQEIEDEFDTGAPVQTVIDEADAEHDITPSQAEHIVEDLKERGELYQPNKDRLRAI